MKRRLLRLIVGVLFSIVCFGNMAYANDDITVKLNGQKIEFDAQPFIEDGRTLVPIRAITEAMDFDVEWDSSTQTATLENAESSVQIEINSNAIEVTKVFDDKASTVWIDVPAQIHEERTFVPLRAVSEAFGAEVIWDNASRTVSILFDIPEEINFQDKGIEYCVRRELADYEDDYDGAITNHMLSTIKKLSVSRSDLEEAGLKIHSLDEIKLMPNLKQLELINQNEITDWSPITYKKEWEYLGLGNIITDNDSFLSQINITDSITFPNYVGWVVIDTMSYKEALDTYWEVRDKLKTIKEECIDRSHSDYETYKKLHDYLVLNMEYDYDYVEEVTADAYRNPLYLALAAGKGECWVYADTYQVLCDIAELPCEIVYGDVKGITHVDETPSWGSHEWNMVKLDGKYYNVDVTFDDPLGMDKDYIRYDYFMITDDELDIFHDHRRAEELD